MEKFTIFLNTYKGRDRILRLLCYMSKCGAGLVQSPETALQLDRLSRQLSTSRACFRLLDDFPTFKDVLDNINSKDEDRIIPKTLSFLENIMDIFFNILDHLSWAIEHKIINSDSSFPDTASTYCWVVSLYISLYKVSKKLSIISRQKSEIAKQTNTKVKKVNLSVQQFSLKLTALKYLADLLFAASYLPKGVLWGGVLSKWQVGALGSVSSLIALYQSLIL